MSNLASSVTTSTNLLKTHRALVDTLCSFLTVLSHHLLYLRRIYPPVSFVTTRAYNYPVRQNRHPDVCAWINDAVAAVHNQLTRNTVQTVSLCIFECTNHEVLERWTVDLKGFQAVQQRDRDVPFAELEEGEGEEDLQMIVNVTDLEANFRALLSRLATVAGKVRPLPEGEGAPECSFTLTVEVKEGGDKPVGRLQKEERAWVAAEPDPFSPSSEVGSQTAQSATKSGKTHPVRRLEVGELRLEMFVEESDIKFTLPTTHKTTMERAAELSYGAGTEKFDPVHGYDLEKPDINRKPNGGTSTDYQRG